MQWRNSEVRYGIVAVTAHWVVAAVVFGLFGLGLWMTSLTYYDTWYRLGPWWHKGLGVMLFLLVALRLVWRLAGSPPHALPAQKRWEQTSAKAVHGLLYVLMFAVMLSGYLISTADGRPVDVFGWFSVPAVISGIEHQEDIAGRVHLILASTLVALAGFHALAALKHHFIDKDRTLARMLGR